MTTLRATRDHFGYTRPASLPMAAHMDTRAEHHRAPTVERVGVQRTYVCSLLGQPMHYDLRGVTDPDAADLAVEAAGAWLRRVDAVFGEARDSAVSRLRRDRRVADVDEPMVEDVLVQCERAWADTEGWFDPWALADGFDPSGLVVGWALGPVADLLSRVATGLRISSAGDVVVRGERAPGLPWAVSVRRPDGRTDLTAVLDVTDVAMSTSYGSGVLDPMTGQPGARLRSATVVGPDAASTDAYATALMACGLDGLRWLAKLRGYEAYVVGLDGYTLSTPGLPRRRS